MTPTLFAGTDAHDEYTFMQTPGALAKLREHQRSFIREEDFRWMSQHGIDAVRIPVGYWLFEGDGPLHSCIGRLDWAVRMAEKYGIKVLVSLHGAPGSQNGEHHSGRSGKVEWFANDVYQAQTIDVLAKLAKRYANSQAVWGIELLNEPKIWWHQLKIRRFYSQAYRQMIKVARSGLVIVFSDGFMPRTMSGALRARAGYPVAMDTHWYHFFMPGWVQRFLPFWVYNIALTMRISLLLTLSRAQPIIVGEWSGVLGGETMARYPRQEHDQLQTAHLLKQMKQFDQFAAWFYWSYKTEARGIYHFRSMVEDGYVDLT